MFIKSERFRTVLLPTILNILTGLLGLASTYLATFFYSNEELTSYISFIAWHVLLNSLAFSGYGPAIIRSEVKNNNNYAKSAFIKTLMSSFLIVLLLGLLPKHETFMDQTLLQISLLLAPLSVCESYLISKSKFTLARIAPLISQIIFIFLIINNDKTNLSLEVSFIYSKMGYIIYFYTIVEIIGLNVNNYRTYRKQHIYYFIVSVILNSSTRIDKIIISLINPSTLILLHFTTLLPNAIKNYVKFPLQILAIITNEKGQSSQRILLKAKIKTIVWMCIAVIILINIVNLLSFHYLVKQYDISYVILSIVLSTSILPIVGSAILNLYFQLHYAAGEQAAYQVIKNVLIIINAGTLLFSPYLFGFGVLFIETSYFYILLNKYRSK